MFYQGKKVLVTGAAGFVGTHFIEELIRQGAKVRGAVHNRPMICRDDSIELVQADLNNLGDCLRACEGVDYLFHAAGAVAGAAVSVVGPMSAISTNLILTVRILEAAWLAKVKRVLVFSSSTGYKEADYPIKEEEMWNSPPPPVYFGYGWMRRYLEILGRFVQDKSETKVAICRPTATYGRHDNFDPKTSHVIPALIRRAAEKENPYVVWGTGEELRDCLHITDLVRGCLLLLDKRPDADPINIGFGDAVSVKEMVGVILEAAGHREAKVVFDTTKPQTIPIRMVDCSKARDLLGFSPKVTVQDGITDTVRWFMENNR